MHLRKRAAQGLIFIFAICSILVAAASAQRTVTLDETSDNGQTTLNVGDTLTVKLPNNAGTGYMWYVDYNNPSLLKRERANTTPPAVGMPGGKTEQVFNFAAVGAGGEQLSFIKRRGGNASSDVADHFRVHVTINQGTRPKTVTVTDEDNHGSVTIRQGDTLVVKLRNNAGTAYRWSVAQNNPELLSPTGKQGTSSKPGNLGGTVYQTFTFKALSGGGESMIFLLQNPNLKGVQAAGRFDISVKIDAV